MVVREKNRAVDRFPCPSGAMYAICAALVGLSPFVHGLEFFSDQYFEKIQTSEF